MEELSSGDPRHVAAENARRKALAVRRRPRCLGADTDVALDGDILGKPADAAQARAFLERLSGRTHDVVGGIALAQDGRVVSEAVVVTPVRFRALDPAADRLVRRRPASGATAPAATRSRARAPCSWPASKGDYFNVVGLPLVTLLELRPELLPAAPVP